MSTENDIARRLADHDGILAVRVQRDSEAACVVINPPSAEDDPEERSLRDQETRVALETSLMMYRSYGNTGSLRIVRGETGPEATTISCFSESYGNYVAAVMVRTGHRISKSLRRMVGRAFAANVGKAA